MSTTTGEAALGDMERLTVQHARKVGDALHQIVLVQGQGDADGVAFLERIGADEGVAHLAGDAHDRDRIHQRIGAVR